MFSVNLYIKVLKINKNLLTFNQLYLFKKKKIIFQAYELLKFNKRFELSLFTFRLFIYVGLKYFVLNNRSGNKKITKKVYNQKHSQYKYSF